MLSVYTQKIIEKSLTNLLTQGTKLTSFRTSNHVLSQRADGVTQGTSQIHLQPDRRRLYKAEFDVHVSEFNQNSDDVLMYLHKRVTPTKSFEKDF